MSLYTLIDDQGRFIDSHGYVITKPKLYTSMSPARAGISNCRSRAKYGPTKEYVDGVWTDIPEDVRESRYAEKLALVDKYTIVEYELVETCRYSAGDYVPDA